MTGINAKVTLTNDVHYSCYVYKSCRACLTNHVGSILCHIVPLVSSSLGGGPHTHTDIHGQ